MQVLLLLPCKITREDDMHTYDSITFMLTTYIHREANETQQFNKCLKLLND